MHLPLKKTLKILGFKKDASLDSSLCRQECIKMGLTTGALFTLIRKAPLGDPIEIELHNALLSLPLSVLSQLEVEIV